MAVFNPQIPPTQDPNYLNYSRVVEAPPPKVDASLGIALNTTAQGIDSGVNVLDTSIKKGIQDKAYAAIDPIRDKYTAGLENIKADLDKGIIPAPVQGVASSTAGSRSVLNYAG